MPGMRVLVVDDERLARDELCFQLEQLGNSEVVAQAGNGIEALAAVERHEPDLVFLDIQMPGLTGFEVARRLLQLDDLQARLDPEVFWGVHRSHLVNINKIKEIVPWFSRNYILRMKDAKGTEIPVSRSQTKRLREYLKL